MTPRERVRRARLQLGAVVLTTAVLRGGGLSLLILGAATVVDRVMPLAGAVRATLLVLVVAAGLAAAVVALWRGRGARSMESVALWVEEHEPSLNYALVTALEPRQAGWPENSAIIATASRARIEQMVHSEARRGLLRPAAALLVLVPFVLAMHPATLVRGNVIGIRRSGRTARILANRLARFGAVVTPPAYSRRAAVKLRDPSNVAALVGSRVAIQGDGGSAGIWATLDSLRLAVGGGDEWTVDVPVSPTPQLLTLHDRQYKALVTLEPVADSAPGVLLREPARDTTYQRVPAGKIDIAADLTDDVGLNTAYVEYMISSGSEESFNTKMVNGAASHFENARSGVLHTAVRLDTMHLSPGSVVHIRVAALDYNDVTGPGKGFSETRTIKIAEPVDSTSINAAPPQEIDSMWVSQRLLNMKTDTLTRTKRRLTHETFVNTSSGYGNTQDDIRKRALAVISLLEDNGVGGSSETEISKMLRQAADLMWTAREDLGIALPDTAMPIMVHILKILDDIRLANRYYLRGILKPVPVDIERARLTGKDTALVSARAARERLRAATADLARRLDLAAAMATSNPSAAADSLVYIRLSALSVAPPVAAPLQQAIDDLHRGMPVGQALARARRSLVPPASALSGPAEWSGVTP
jgi:hypothetical protein